MAIELEKPAAPLDLPLAVQADVPMPAWRSFARRLDNARVWSLLASMAARASGFMVTLVLARLTGRTAVGEYSLIVNTAGSVVAPLLSPLNLKATMAAAQPRESPAGSRSTLFGELAIGAMVSVPCAAAFAFLYSGVGGGRHPVRLGTVAGVVVVISQLLVAIATGALYGRSRFKVVGLLIGCGATLATLASIPLTWRYGLIGALGVLVAWSAASLLLLAGAYVVSTGPGEEQGLRWRQLGISFAALVDFVPNICATAAGSAVNWYCSIYLVRAYYNVQGVALVAVATQWLTMMLIIPTSWGGLTLKRIADATQTGTKPMVLSAVSHLLRKNSSAALAVGLIVGAGSVQLAAIYGMGGTPLPLLIGLNAAVAVTLSMVNVFERLFVALRIQRSWLMLSSVSYLAQALVTLLLVRRSLLAVPLGALAGALILLLAAASDIFRAGEERFRAPLADAREAGA